MDETSELADLKPGELLKLDRTPTASVLGMYRRELIAEGFTADSAEQLVRDFSRGDRTTPLVLKRSTPDNRCTLCGLPKDVCKSFSAEESLRG